METSVTTSPLEIDALSKLFHFDEEDLYPYLLKNFSFVPFLTRAHVELAKIFPESIFILEVHSDLEIENWETLFIQIVNNLQDPFFDTKVQGFVLNWMFNEDPEIRKRVTIKEVW
jgi:hypothetical protein